jgi:hypothetical protein
LPLLSFALFQRRNEIDFPVRAFRLFSMEVLDALRLHPKEIFMKSRIAILTASLAFTFSLAAHAQSSDTSGSNVQQPGQPQSAQRSPQSGWPDTQSASKEQCDHLQGNAKTICNAEIKAMKMVQDGKEKVAQHDSPQTRLEFAETRADAKFEVAEARCGDLVGEAREACKAEAQAMRDLSKARAKRQALAQATSQSSGGGAATGNTSSSSSMSPSGSTDASSSSGASSASSAESNNAGSTVQSSAADTSGQTDSGAMPPPEQPQSSQPTKSPQ